MDSRALGPIVAMNEHRSPLDRGLAPVAASADRPSRHRPPQFALLANLVAAERDTAHIIDISGAQRMRSQRIAFLVEAMRARHGVTVAERAEL